MQVLDIAGIVQRDLVVTAELCSELLQVAVLALTEEFGAEGVSPYLFSI
jgi:hypothetical protein